MSRRASMEVAVAGRSLRLTNVDKVLWPEAGFTKGAMLSYYEAIAPVIVPHLRDRPLTLKRCPDGVDGTYWFQSNCPHPPAWMRTHRVPAAGGDGAFDYCVVDDAAALLWVVNVGAVELHPFLARAPHVDRPDHVVFDLDPGPPASLAECCDVALLLRGHLGGMGLRALVKTSGAAGLHVYVPVAGHSFDDIKEVARTIARDAAEARPDLVVERKQRAVRRGKVLIDWAQNNPMRSLVAAYSLRATAWPLVSMPLAWEEVESATRHRDVGAVLFGPGEALRRVEREGDLFAAVLQPSQRLPRESLG